MNRSTALIKRRTTDSGTDTITVHGINRWVHYQPPSPIPLLSVLWSRVCAHWMGKARHFGTLLRFSMEMLSRVPWKRLVNRVLLICLNYRMIQECINQPSMCHWMDSLIFTISKSFARQINLSRKKNPRINLSRKKNPRINRIRIPPPFLSAFSLKRRRRVSLFPWIQ